MTGKKIQIIIVLRFFYFLTNKNKFYKIKPEINKRSNKIAEYKKQYGGDINSIYDEYNENLQVKF